MSEFTEFWKSDCSSEQQFNKEQFSKPYSSLEDLPEPVKELPKHAQEIFRAAFNSAYKNPPAGKKAEEYAFAVAWAAVKKAGYKKSDGDSATEVQGDNTGYRNKHAIYKAVGIEIVKSTMDLMSSIDKYLKDFGGSYDSYSGGNYGADDSEENPNKKKKKETHKSDCSCEKCQIEKSKKEVSFDFLIEKAYVTDAEGNILNIPYEKYQKNAMEGEIDLDNMYIEGVASTTNVDHDQERMSQEAIDAMLAKINDGGVPLQNEHQKTWDSQ